MSDQVTVSDSQKTHSVSELKDGETISVNTGELKADRDNKLWISAYGQDGGPDWYKCARATKSGDGFNVDLSDCGLDQKMISVDHSLREKEQSFYPVRKLTGADPAFYDSAAAYLMGGLPPANSLPKSIDGQAVVPTFLKSGNLEDFKEGETAYISPFLFYAKDDGKFWLPQSGLPADGWSDRQKCMKVEMLSNGVNIDGSFCQTSVKPFTPSIFTSSELSKNGLLPVRSLKGY